MKKRTLSRIVALSLAASFLLSACSGGNTDPNSGTPTSEGSQESTPVSTGPKIYRFATAQAAANINPHRASTSFDDEISALANAALYRYTPNESKNGSILSPNLAADEPVKMDETGKVWQIKVSPDAKWANGESMNADTFIYSYQQALNPNLANPPAISLAVGYIEIVGAEDYYTQIADETTLGWDTVGIEKIDDMTIQITCLQNYNATDVMRHFASRITMPVYEKMYEELMNDSKTSTQYGTEADKIMAAGPFVISVWTKGSETIFEKNENYIHADTVKLDGVNRRVVADTGTQLQMFESGELDYIFLSSEGVNKYEEDPRFIEYGSRVVRNVEINRGNPDQPLLGNVKFRQALYYAQDRETMAKLGKQKAAPYYVSTTSVAYADGTTFRSIPEANSYIPANGGYNPELAKKLFDEACAEEGVTEKVTLQMNYYDSREDVKMMAEYQQKSLPEVFGVDKFELKLQAMPSNQMFDTMKSHMNDPAAYELSWGSWSWGSSDDFPNRSFEPHQSDYSRRNAPYNNAELDRLYLESISEKVRLDEKLQAQYAMDLEKLFIEDVITIPIFEVINKCMFQDHVVTPLSTYDNKMGWGIAFMDMNK